MLSGFYNTPDTVSAYSLDPEKCIIICSHNLNRKTLQMFYSPLTLWIIENIRANS